MPLSTGAGLGPYEILFAIGAGGMGEVWLAEAIAALSHPNIVNIHSILHLLFRRLALGERS